MAPTAPQSLLLSVVFLLLDVRGVRSQTDVRVNSTPDAQDSCVLLPTSSQVRDTLNEFLLGGASLVYIQLEFESEAGDGNPEAGREPFFRLERDLGMFQPWSWQRSTSRQGRSLLMLSDSYDVLSLSLLSMRVEHLHVTLTSSPEGCLTNMTAQALYQSLRTLLLNDFKAGKEGGSLSRDEHVCYREVRDDGEDVAEFIYVCCHNNPERGSTGFGEGAECDDVRQDPWISLLLLAVVVIKVLVVLFSPNLLPDSMYRLKYATLNYVYHLPQQGKVTLRMLKTRTPWVHGQDDRVVRLRKLPDLPKLREMVDSWPEDRVHDVTVNHVHLAVKARKLLPENYVPVGVFKIIYNNLFLCRLRHISSLTSCCNTNILGTLNPGLNLPTWFKCARLFARVVLLCVLILPWIVRLLIYYNYEQPVMASKKRSAQLADLHLPFSGSFTLHLTPLHLLFVLCYVILCLDSFLYGVLSDAFKEKMKLVVRRCLRDMRERSKVSVCGWVAKLLVFPCTCCGLLGFLLFPIYLLLLIPIMLPVLAFYLFPALNLSIRLILHLFIFVCPAPLARTARRLTHKIFDRVNHHVRLDTVTSGESFHKRSDFSKRELPFQILVVLVCLVTFWSITFLLMELLSFLVEMAVYTFIGLIVTADITSQYLSVVFFLLLYGHSCFASMHNKYKKFYRVLHGQLLEMMRPEIDAIARTAELDQENTALRVQGNMAAPATAPPVTLRVIDGRPRWITSSLLLFLDNKDTPYTPERFFNSTINLNYCGCPGPLYVNMLNAIWSFLQIIVFLLFVFVVVMAFGSAYSVSSTNQLLATVAGGFIPFVFSHFFSRSGQGPGVDKDSVQFKTHFHTAINTYKQTWPLFDIDDTVSVTTSSTAAATMIEDKDKTEVVNERSNPFDSPPLSSSTPYSTLPANSDVSTDKPESSDWEDTTLDVIFDVSRRSFGRGTHAQSGLGEIEAGSQTMLNRKNEVGGGGSESVRSARKFQPAEPSVQDNDENELLPV